MIKITNRLTKDVVVADGAMGTVLMESIDKAMALIKKTQPELAKDSDIKDRPLELLNVTHPEIITKVHRNYVAAGAEVVYTNTLCANKYRLAPYKKSVDEVVKAAVTCARKSGASYVALDIGQFNGVIEPFGNINFEEAVETYKEIVRAGAGCDLIAIETMTDLAHARAAVIAAKELTSKPVIITMSFDDEGKTPYGVDVETMAITFSEMGVDGIGVNCTPEPKVLKKLTERIAAVTNVPIVLKPGAGLPDEKGKYHVSPEEFASFLTELLPLGVRMVGGCCGTTPDHIMKLAVEVGRFKKYAMSVGWHVAIPKRELSVSTICSAKKWLDLDNFRVIGKLINEENNAPIIKAVYEDNNEYILEVAREQQEAGADILCINATEGGLDNPSAIKMIINAIQSELDIPLMVESINSATTETALRNYQGKLIISYAVPEDSVIREILPIVAKYGAALVGLATITEGIKSAAATYSYGELIYRQALKYGIDKENIIIDCNLQSLKTSPDTPMNTLEAMQRIRRELSVKTILNVDKVADGYSDDDKEKLVANYLVMALCYGLSLPVINTKNKASMEAVESVRRITNK